MKLIYVFALSISALSWAAEAPKYNYKLLRDRRADVALPRYTLLEKQLVLDQAKMVLTDLFVHRDLKIRHHGPDADALPSLEALSLKLGSISDEEFHQSLIRSFQKLRDWHTTYHLPKPYSCYRTFLPFALRPIQTPSGKALAVSTVSPEEILKVIPFPVKIMKGDLLVEYNGKSPFEVVESLRYPSRGANDPAALRNGVDLLSWINNKLDLMPTEDVVKVKFRSPLGLEYSLELPWVSRVDEDCLGSRAEKTINFAENDFRREHNQFFKVAPVKSKSFKSLNETLKTTAEPVLKYKTITNTHGTFAYLKLDSFVPEKLTVEEVIQEVKKLLEGELAKTDGLIFDVRSNGGGYIRLAEYMVQLFTPKDLLPLNFLLRNSPANRHYFSVFKDNKFAKTILDAEAAGTPYTTPISINNEGSMNDLGQSYFRPVAVFTNSTCYSSCDMFSALMQDFGAGLIVGEDSTTGAGGANNTNLDSMFTELLLGKKGPFEKLPAGQNIGFSFRQSLRVGRHAGEVIEDIGVLSDLIVPAKLEDILNDSSEQLLTISGRLASLGPKFKSQVIAKSTFDLKLGTKAQVPMAWEETDAFEFRAGSEKERIDVSPSGSEVFPLPAIVPVEAPLEGRFEIYGFRGLERVWRKVIQYRTVPETLALPHGEAFFLDFESPTPFVVYGEKGWNIGHGKLRVSQGPKYADDLNTKASLFVNLPVRGKTILSFDADVVTEKDYDFFSVLVVADGKTTVLVEKLSGSVELKRYEVDLTAFEGKNIELRFLFTSDAAVSQAGVTVDNLKIGE